MITVQELELISYCLINTVSLGLLTWSQVLLNGQSFQVNPSWCLTRWREGTEDSSNKAGIVSSRLRKYASAWLVRRKWGKRSKGGMRAQAGREFWWSGKLGVFTKGRAKVSNFHLANVFLQDLSESLLKALQNEDCTSSAPKVSTNLH